MPFFDPKKPLRSDEHFSKLMFKQKGGSFSSVSENQTEEKASHADFDLYEIMNHVDVLMSAYSQLKPLMRNITPLVEAFKKGKN
ncbi:hypothetical protein [Peribacillus tepidiphilus]|jgi:hypothetical protein|uniref:hypothetical protein n=1 Tax=Peribacillus tepidiphilus TaxID=2652445 RepID=UPI001292A5AA|nr:hypothetical protein [Peribacillus tepidiphilus]